MKRFVIQATRFMADAILMQSNVSSRRRSGKSQWICATNTLLAICTLAGCDGGLHRKGDWRIELTASYDEAIRGETHWADGLGRSEAAAGAISGHYFLADRTALILGLTPYRIYNQSDGDVYAGEIQLGTRYYAAQWGEQFPSAIYAEALGGVTLGRHSIPEDGSAFNFTQDLGIGIETKLTERVSWVAGYRFKHLSNGNLFNDDNPSQNDHQVYTGFSIGL